MLRPPLGLCGGSGKGNYEHGRQFRRMQCGLPFRHNLTVFQFRNRARNPRLDQCCNLSKAGGLYNDKLQTRCRRRIPNLVKRVVKVALAQYAVKVCGNVLRDAVAICV
jgi:hypothetical protein